MRQNIYKAVAANWFSKFNSMAWRMSTETIL